jgi:hypothetical protein
MIFSGKALRSILIVSLSAVLLLVTALAIYDRNTKKRTFEIIARQIPAHASIAQIQRFMSHNTARYGFDEYNMEFSGFLMQSGADKFLANRQVRIILKIKNDTQTLERADVQISYTFF